MEPTVLKLESFKEQDFGHMKLTNMVNADDWPVSVNKVERVGDDVREGYDPENDTVYFVMSGSGKSFLNGVEYPVNAGDCIVIPRGTRYKNMAGTTLLAISCPKYQPQKRVYTE